MRATWPFPGDVRRRFGPGRRLPWQPWAGGAADKADREVLLHQAAHGRSPLGDWSAGGNDWLVLGEGHHLAGVSGGPSRAGPRGRRLNRLAERASGAGEGMFDGEDSLAAGGLPEVELGKLVVLQFG
ncbi:hypothetical protein ACFLTC_03460, partial [Chloroflexota bacterium]